MMKKGVAPPVVVEPGVYWKIRSTTLRWHWPTELDWFLFRLASKLAFAALALGVLLLWWGGMRDATVGEFARAWREENRPTRGVGMGLLFGSSGIAIELLALISLVLDIQGPPSPKRRRRRRNMRGL